ncbi:MAG TPA: hypothetical protein VFY10_15745 [Dehalococcoidia bacterium]|nr:hypothetical protein [Dehalococcoidia bacterium]
MTRSLIHMSVLLLLISFVGIVGANGSLNPAKIQSAKAAALDIVLLSDNGSSLTFHVTAAGCPSNLAPGSACSAHVVVDNQGTEAAEIGQPTGSVSGALNTCAGDDPANPGAGGPNIALSLTNISYGDAVHLLNHGNSESFDLAFSLDSAIGNACQGQTATITVSLQTGLPDATATPTPTLPLSVDVAPTAVSSPSGQTGSGQPAGQVAVTSTLVSQIQSAVTTPNPTLVSEVLPTRFPVTGQGWQPRRSTNLVALFFWVTGSAGVLLLTYAVVATRRKRGEC